MSNYPKYLLGSVIGAMGDFVVPPETAEEAGDGRLSMQEGWGILNQTPLPDGGIAPFREDMNGLAYLLSQFLVWQQQGGLMNYTSSLNYEVGNEILSDGKKWKCVAENGPGTTAGVNSPAPGSDYWKRADQSRYAGEVVPFYNVTLGGSDGRRPIFWGETEPDEGWVLCDGGSDGQGGNVPNLIGKSIEGSNTQDAGGSSGGVTVSTSGLPVGAILLMAGTLSDPNGEYVPATASQSLDIASYQEAYASLGTTWGTGESGKFLTPSFNGRWLKMSGSDTLGELLSPGVPNIVGTFNGPEKADYGYIATGAFYNTGKTGCGTNETDYDNIVFGFDASKCDQIYGASDEVQPRSAVVDAYVHVKTTSTSGVAQTGLRYKLAYFIKLPD